MAKKQHRKPEKIGQWELDEVDREILKVMVDYPDISASDVAEAVNITPYQLKARQDRPSFRRAHEDLTATAEAYMKHVQASAVRKLHALVRDNDKKIALQAIKIALQPMLNKQEININQRREIVFRTKIGESGQLLQEVIEVEVSDILPPPQIEGA